MGFNIYTLTESHGELVRFIYYHADILREHYGEWYPLTDAVLYSYSHDLQSKKVDLNVSVPYVKRLLNVARGGTLLAESGLFIRHDHKAIYKLDMQLAYDWLMGNTTVRTGIAIESDPRIELSREVIDEGVDRLDVAETPDQIFPIERDEEAWA